VATPDLLARLDLPAQRDRLAPRATPDRLAQRAVVS
jgi:hypothetical protein